mgnify:CR=1 FL=1
MTILIDPMDPILREAIELFKERSKDKLYFNGINKNANKMAHILPLFQGFVMDHADFWAINYGYRMRGDKPGPLSSIYPLFRDTILLQALIEMRAEVAEKCGVSPAKLPPVEYVMKHTPRMNGAATPRAVQGWVMLPKSRYKGTHE